jgi:Amt family ammonium transporter
LAGPGDPAAAAAGSLDGSRARHLPGQDLARATVTRSPIALTVVDPEGIVLLWNPAAERLFGWVSDEVIGHYLPIVDDRSRDEFHRCRDTALAGQELLELEVRRRHKDGHLVDVSLSTVALHDLSGRAVSVLGAYQDIRGRKLAEAELVRQAQVDDLTGLVNRRGLLDELRNARPGTERQVAVIAIDLDHFKQVNDAFGHLAGDQVLSAFAKRLDNAVRPGDIVARLEGAAFGILMVGIDPKALRPVVGRLLKGLTQIYVVEGHEVEITVTGGVALQCRKESPTEVLRRASVALHHAKAVSRGGFQVLDDALDRAFQDRVELSIGLRGAAQRGELRLQYQPIVSASTCETVGAEALVRWQHPEHGLLRPDRFIPIAEETGSMLSVGRWVLHQACATLRQWTEEDPTATELSVSVNLSVVQLQDRELVDDVRAALKHSRLKPERLHLEVTESALITHPASAARALERLRGLGVTLAIDDFGTGNSSLTALQRFPFQVLKIDRSFVSGIGIRPADTTIVTATLALAHGLGLTVVAEGVETRDQSEFLFAHGCEELQGYLFGRPVSASRIRHPSDRKSDPSSRGCHALAARSRAASRPPDAA